jgi:hypothetical protein
MAVPLAGVSGMYGFALVYGQRYGMRLRLKPQGQ